MIEQGTPEWFALRCGKVTASRIADVMAKPREPGKGMRVNYMAQLLCERLTGIPAKTYSNDTMEEAHEWEPKARAYYAFHTDNTVRKVDFIDHIDMPMAGCSPDGLVGDDGGVEIKCPFVATHIDTLLNGKIDSKYLKQIQWSMACTGRKWWHYVSYNDDLPERMRGCIIKVDRDPVMIGEITEAVRSFQLELDLKLSVLTERFK
jgi:putative phage-type endonuclease